MSQHSANLSKHQPRCPVWRQIAEATTASASLVVCMLAAGWQLVSRRAGSFFSAFSRQCEETVLSGWKSKLLRLRRGLVVASAASFHSLAPGFVTSKAYKLFKLPRITPQAYTFTLLTQQVLMLASSSSCINPPAVMGQLGDKSLHTALYSRQQVTLKPKLRRLPKREP